MLEVDKALYPCLHHQFLARVLGHLWLSLLKSTSSPTPSSSSPRLIFLKWKSRWVSCVKTFQFPISFWKKSNFLGLCTNDPCSCSVLLSSLSPAGCLSLLSCASHTIPQGGPCFMPQCLCMCASLFPECSSLASIECFPARSLETLLAHKTWASWKHSLSHPQYTTQGPALRWIQGWDPGAEPKASLCSFRMHKTPPRDLGWHDSNLPSWAPLNLCWFLSLFGTGNF